MLILLLQQHKLLLLLLLCSSSPPASPSASSASLGLLARPLVVAVRLRTTLVVPAPQHTHAHTYDVSACEVARFATMPDQLHTSHTYTCSPLLQPPYTPHQQPPAP